MAFSACRDQENHIHPGDYALCPRGEYDRIHGFELGVDDYVVKPFSPKN